MPQPMILRGGRVLNPATGLDEVRDVGVADGVLVAAASLHGADIRDVSGLVVAPGFVDLHVHLREPGQVEKEDIQTGTRAAAAGGFTTIVAMPNTVPAVDSPAILGDVYERCRRHAVVRVLQTAAITRGRAGRELTDARELKAAGAAALTDDGSGVQAAGLMLAALRQARAVGLPVLDHCEDDSLVAGGVMNAGEVAGRLGLTGNPAVSEELAVVRNLLVAREAGWPIHVQHVSTAAAVEAVRQARHRGVPVTAEATPHHLTLTDAACLEHGTNAKMNPPLRTEADRRAIVEGLRDGVITVIATDHAPHTAAEKAKPFAQAPSGIVGLETAVPVCLTALYHTGILSLAAFVSRFTTGPRAVLGLPADPLAEGSPADLTLLDLERQTVVDTGTFESRSRNCPYHGWHCRGRVAATIVGGRWIYRASP